MSGIMRVSALTWENIEQLAIITPNDILEVTAMVGKEVEELSQFLEKKYPGLMAQFSEKYLAIVMAMLPAGSLPSVEEMKIFVEALRREGAGAQHIRNEAVKYFYGVVNMESPQYAKRGIMALIEFALGEWEQALHCAGFAQCNFEDVEFDDKMLNGSRDSFKDTLLNSERKKAEVLIEIIRERRLAA